MMLVLKNETGRTITLRIEADERVSEETRYHEMRVKPGEAAGLSKEYTETVFLEFTN